MGIPDNFTIRSAFRQYKDVVFGVTTDLHFWNSGLEKVVSQYNERPSQMLFEAIFAVYNMESEGPNGSLEDFKKTISVSGEDADKKRQLFMAWVTNLTVLKLYTSSETFLLQAIWLRFYPHLKNPTFNKKAADALHREIMSHLFSCGLSKDSTNNRYLMVYLKDRSAEISSFLDQPMRVDLITNWGNFFELFSILRNTIAHQGTIVSLDSKNDIQGKAKDVFLRHFSLVSDHSKSLHLFPVVEQFGNFVGFVNDFSLNVVKFLFGEQDLRFLDIEAEHEDIS